MELTNTDYKKIIKYYKLSKPKNMSYKKLAENTLSGKLCRCIKKINSIGSSEKQAIGACRETIFKKRNINFFNFTCKKKYELLPKKHSRKKLKKFSKKIGFNKTKKQNKNKILKFNEL